MKEVESPAPEFRDAIKRAGYSEDKFEAVQGFCDYPPANQGIGPVATVITVKHKTSGVVRSYKVLNGEPWIKWISEFEKDLGAGKFD